MICGTVVYCEDLVMNYKLSVHGSVYTQCLKKGPSFKSGAD